MLMMIKLVMAKIVDKKLMKSPLDDHEQGVDIMKSPLSGHGQKVDKIKSHLDNHGQEINEMKSPLDDHGKEVEQGVDLMKSPLHEHGQNVDEMKSPSEDHGKRAHEVTSFILPFMCSVCLQAFHSIDQLCSHFVLHPQVGAEHFHSCEGPGTSQISKPIYSCSLCLNVFPTLCMLEKHVLEKENSDFVYDSTIKLANCTNAFERIRNGENQDTVNKKEISESNTNCNVDFINNNNSTHSSEDNVKKETNVLLECYDSSLSCYQGIETPLSMSGEIPVNCEEANNIDHICSTGKQDFKIGQRELCNSTGIANERIESAEPEVNSQKTFNSKMNNRTYVGNETITAATTSQRQRKTNLYNENQGGMDNINLGMEKHDAQSQSIMPLQSVKSKRASKPGTVPYYQQDTTCCICGKQMKKTSLKGHMTTHSDDRRYTCERCGQSFKRRDYLKYHNRCNADRPKYRCETCGKDFLTLYYLRHHRKIHTNDRSFQCLQCPMKFTTNSILKAHLKRHAEIKPYQCTICGKFFTRQDGLSAHTKTHGKTRDFTCSTCSKCFVSRTHLTRHEKIHQAVKPHICDVCGKGFVQRRALRSHLGTHGVILEPCSVTINF